ncbi:MAG: hypothetical protein ACLGPL_07080 [Acidobacteriota bacterium]
MSVASYAPPGASRVSQYLSLGYIIEITFICWIFAGVMGKMIPVFFIPAIKSLRPHYFVAMVMAAMIPLNYMLVKYRFSAKSPAFYSILLWMGFVGVALASFGNLLPAKFIFYPRQGSTDLLIVKWFFMLVVLLLFLHFYHAAKERPNLIARAVNMLDTSFIYYFLFGWPLYLGVATHKISLETYSLFTVPGEDLDSLFRFCPGDYPNGAGEMLAFYIVFLLLMRRNLRFVPIKFMVAIPALLLTTTRGGIFPAFAVFGAVMAYIAVMKVGGTNFYRMRLINILAIAAVVGSIVFLLTVGRNIEIIAEKMDILYKGITNVSESKSVNMRYVNWAIAIRIFFTTLGMGDGFAQYLETHNLVIELMAEIGILGTLFFVLFVAVRFMAVFKAYLNRAMGRKGLVPDFIRFILVATPVNAFFALTNHNLFHFTFWFLAVATFMIEARTEKDAVSEEATAEAPEALPPPISPAQAT